MKLLWSNSTPQEKITSLPEALKYGQKGWELLLQTLNDESLSVQVAAYELLQENAEPDFKQLLQLYDPYLRLKHYRTITGHSEGIRCLTISPNGQILATGSHDKTIKLWDLPSGQLRATLTGHSHWIKSLAISPDGQILASGSYDKTIKLWDLPNGQLRATLTGHSGNIECLTISPDSQILASGASDKSIKLWDLPSGQLRATLAVDLYRVGRLAISSDSQILASCEFSDQSPRNWTIKLWSFPDRELKTTLLTGKATNPIRFFGISHDGHTLIVCLPEGGIKLWDLPSGELKTTLTEKCSCCLLSADGHTLITGYTDIKLWDLATGQLKATLTGHSGRVVSSLAISPNGHTFASTGHDETIKLWDLPSGKLRTTIMAHSQFLPKVLFRINPNGPQIFAIGNTNTNIIRLWEIENPRHPRLDPIEFFHHYLTLKAALNNDSSGLKQVIEALKSKSWEIYEIAKVLLQEREESLVKQALEEYSCELSSAISIDYRRLQYLLSHQKWQEAEQETEDILLNISGCEKGADIQSILKPRTHYVFDDEPCGETCSISNQDLDVIYDLWKRYSNMYASFKHQHLPFWTNLKTKLEQIWARNEKLKSYVKKNWYSLAYSEDQKYRLD